MLARLLPKLSSTGRVCRRQLSLVTRTPGLFAGTGQDADELFDLYEAPAARDGAWDGSLRPQIGPDGRQVRKQRAEVHRDGDWHRAIHVWVCDRDGNMLLQQRSEHKDTYPLRWDVSAAGHITAGDEALDTAVRELDEELGLVVEPAALDLAFILPHSSVGSTEKHGAFECNEYQDIFTVLVPGGALLREHTFKVGTGEVADLRVVPGQELFADMRRGSEELTPFTEEYVERLERAVADRQQ